MSDKARKWAAGMSISAAALLGIAAHEGFRGTAYKDVTGVPTIGYGETHGVHMGETITKDRAFKQLSESADIHAKQMVRCIHVPISQGEYDAYIDFTYNVGSGAFCTSTLNKKLNSGDYEGACKELLKWTKAGGKDQPGLVKRRHDEYNTCIGP